MKSIFKVLSILAAALCMLACTEKPGPGEEPTDDPTEKPAQMFKISAMSFNIKWPDSSETGVKNWDNRKTGVIAMIMAKEPDLIGLQECYISQRTFIIENFPHYDCYGLVKTSGKDSGSGETMSILWNKDKFEKLECGTFWLSETPEQVSKGWGAANTRDCTWILFKHKESGQMFYHFNTHLDHQVEKAQIEGAKLIRKRMTELNKNGYPVILTGDMNVPQNHQACAIFEMDNARVTAPEYDGGVTCHGYGGKTQVIDHVFSSGLEVWHFQTVKGPWAGYQYISDHNPVMAQYRYHY